MKLLTIQEAKTFYEARRETQEAELKAIEEAIARKRIETRLLFDELDLDKVKAKQAHEDFIEDLRTQREMLKNDIKRAQHTAAKIIVQAETKEREVNEREKNFEKKEKEVETREVELALRERGLKKRQITIETKEKELELNKRKLEDQINLANTTDTELAVIEEQVEDKKKELTDLIQAHRKTVEAFNEQRHTFITERQTFDAILKERTKDLEAREKKLEMKLRLLRNYERKDRPK